MPVSERPEIDRWILSLLHSLVAEVAEDLDDYEPTKAARAIDTFVNDHLSNWYVRLNRRRFWAGEMDSDKLAAYQTLYECLKTVALLMAPFAPFYSDRMYGDLTAPAREPDGYASVHLADFPVTDPALIDKDLEERMALAQQITSAVLALRRKVNLKVRQPLQTLLVPVMNDRQRVSIDAVRNIILDEVNVKELKLVDNEESGLVKRVKADFKKLGPRYGKIMKDLGKAIASMSQKEIAELESNGSYTFTALPDSPTVTVDDVDIAAEDVPGWQVANDGQLTVALDVTVTPELKNEGLARELVNRIQNERKSRDFDITDKIVVELSDTPEVREALESFGSYLANQVLANDVRLVEGLEGDDTVAFDIDNKQINARIHRDK